MGWTMKGMTPSPSPVVAHFLVFSATEGNALASPMRDPAQIRLMRKPDIIVYSSVHLAFGFERERIPGTITEAKACHTRVSKAARATFPESESGI